MITSHNQLVLRSGRVVFPEGVRPADIIVRDGRIAAIETHGTESDKNVEDAGDLVIMAGLVDTHVHINEPGRTEWEGFETATRAAAAGGITTLIDMPLNSTPVTTTVSSLNVKLTSAAQKLSVDCGYYAGMIPENSTSLAPLLDAGVVGVKAFLVHSGIDDFPNATERDLRAAMSVIAKKNLPLLVHCELPDATAYPVLHTPNSYSEYLDSRPRRWEHDAIDLMIRLCKEYNCRTHIVHLASADEIPMLRQARKAGLPLTVETCPHYLFFTAEEIVDGDTRFKCAPPIREKENRERLWEGLKEGVIDFIVSDHSPCPPSMKCLESGDFQKAWGGISSLQFGLSIVWTEARQRGFCLQHVARWMSQRPAEFVDLGRTKGSIAAGGDADFVIWDPDASFKVEGGMIHHRHKVTPYEGRTLFGKVVSTYLRGRKIFDNGNFAKERTGQIILRNAA